MPRYENEGFGSNKRKKNDDLDRTVPLNENYYSDDPFVDLNFNNRTSSRGDVIDNQNRQNGFNPCDEAPNYSQSPISPPQRNNFQQNATNFQSETPNDFIYENQSRNNAPIMRSNSNGSGRKPPKKSRRNSNGNKDKHSHLTPGKRILIIVLALILVIVGSIFPILARINYDDHVDNKYISSSELKSSSSVKNVLLLGVDARSDDTDSASRSDSMMLISVDMKHHCIKLVSFLRDTWVYIPSEDKNQRLNAACSYDGYKGVVDTIEYNFKIKIDNYIVTDFEMFKVLVDAIGGVEIDVTKAEAKEVTNHPKRYGNVTLKSGKQNLTGKQALAYCRIRKIDSDFYRAKRQRTVMSAIIKKMKSSNPFSLYKMAYNAAPYIETDMTKSQLTKFTLQAGICAGSIHQTRVPFADTWSYATIDGNSVISIDKDKNKEKLQEYIYEKTSSELTSEEATTE